MIGKTLTLFELFGFEIKIDLSWVLIALLITWSLATGFFPAIHEGLPSATYWWMGVAGAIGLFLSLVFHELAHSLVARRYGLQIRGITLFIFGGVAELEDEPPTPKSEFFMALAGPLSSFVLAGGFYWLSVAAEDAKLPVPLYGTASYLALLNGLLAGFNLLPAFPLDGGRAFRAALWWRTNDLKRATRIAAKAGSGFGLVLMAVAFVYLLLGSFVAAVWWFLIGTFLRMSAKASYYQLLTQKMLDGVPVRRFMTPDPVTVPGTTSVAELLDQYVYRYHHKMFPVTEKSGLVGCVTLNEIKRVPREDRSRLAVRTIMDVRSTKNTIDAETPSVKALAALSRSGDGRLAVMDGDRLVGIIALKDILDFVATRMELEDLG